MTDRIKGFFVTLEHDMRDDDCQEIITAIKMIPGVISVVPEIAGFEDHHNRAMIRMELEKKLWKALKYGIG